MKQRIIFCISIIFFLTSCIINKKGMMDAEYKGTILKVYNDTNNRYYFTFLIKTTEGNTYEEIAEWFPYSWKYASVGDSIIKEKGDLYITIKKRSGHSQIFYFDP